METVNAAKIEISDNRIDEPKDSENKTPKFKYYVAIDWAKSNMAVARMTLFGDKIDILEGPADIKTLIDYFNKLHNKVLLTFEESGCSQWLYVELKDYVTEIIVCNAYRNHLLKDGPKSDKIDAKKMVHMLRAGLLKPVFHSGDEFIYIRKVVNGYRSLIKRTVQTKNQKAALFYSNGLNTKLDKLKRHEDLFVLDGLEKSLEICSEEKERYDAEFKRLSSKHKVIRLLKSLPGIADIGSVKIAAIVVDPYRFKTRNHFLSYCGLVKNDRNSGGKSYGKKDPRYCRELKAVFKTAANTATRSDKNNPMRDYFNQLCEEDRLPDYVATHRVARRIAILALGIMKEKKKFDRWRYKKSSDLNL